MHKDHQLPSAQEEPSAYAEQVRPAQPEGPSADMEDAAPKSNVSCVQKQIDDVRKGSARANSIKGAFFGRCTALNDSAAPQPKAPANSKQKRANQQPPRNKKDLKPPPGLAGSAMRSVTATGVQRMCFSYNIGSCKSKRRVPERSASLLEDGQWRGLQPQGLRSD